MNLFTRITTAAGLAAACALPAAGALAADLKVGFITSLSGPVSSLGIPYEKGLKAAVAYQAEAGGRKVQVVQQRDGKTVTLAEFKGAIREIEVHPGETAEWWFVPVAAGRATDLRCGIVGTDGVSHKDHGMVGEIVIE